MKLLRIALALALQVAVATLLRSAIFAKWATVVASLALLVGSYAAAPANAAATGVGRGPTWSGVSPSSAPLPTPLSLPAMLRFDRAAAAALLAITARGPALLELVRR